MKKNQRRIKRRKNETARNKKKTEGRKELVNLLFIILQS